MSHAKLDSRSEHRSDGPIALHSSLRQLSPNVTVVRVLIFLILIGLWSVAPVYASVADGHGNYTQILCADPASEDGLGISGMPEGLSNPASIDLWQTTTSEVNCSSGRISAHRGVPMKVGFTTTYAQGTWSALLYQAPADVTINEGTIYRAEFAHGANDGFMGIDQQGGDWEVLYSLPRNDENDSGDWFAGNVASRGTFYEPFASENKVNLTISPDKEHWDVNADCDPNGNNNSSCTLESDQWEYRIFGGAISLNAVNDPQAINISGPMTSETPLRGSESVTFAATDQGPGLAYVKLLVDGKTVQSQTIDTNDGHCVPVPGHDAYTWAYQIPCKTSVGGHTYYLNTALVSDGTHHVQVVIEDAAGNQSIVVDRIVQTDNAPSVSTPPQITGTAQLGSELTGSDGTFTGPAEAGSVSTPQAQWLRCSSPDIPASCQAIAGSNATTYTPVAADEHYTIVYQDTVSDSDGTTIADSQPTPEISAPGSSSDTSTSVSSTTNNVSSVESVSNEALLVARGAANGSPATDQANLSVHWATAAHASSVKASYARGLRAEGRLIGSGGQPIAGAVVQVVGVPSSPGLATYAEGSVTTAADGTFVFDTRGKRSSRTLEFEYKSHANDLSLAAEASLNVNVPVPISMRVTPRSVGRGSRIRMAGSVPAQIPAGGKQIVLQALAIGVRGAKWQTFNVVRTSKSGRFKASYRFRFAGPARYRIRAVSRYEQDYPYLANNSSTTLVRES